MGRLNYLSSYLNLSRRGRMVVEFTTTCAIVANKPPFDINSVVFHFDDLNYGRRSQPYFFLTIATQLFFVHNL
jgi:hypothetical protein